MKTIVNSIILLGITLAISFSSGNVFAGNNASKLSDAGYFCFPVAPNNWIHCLRMEKFGHPAVPVKVFSEDGSEFLGTEQLLRYDIYKGQPCPQDGLEQWEYLGDPPYFACHHFDTGHH